MSCKMDQDLSDWFASLEEQKKKKKKHFIAELFKTDLYILEILKKYTPIPNIFILVYLLKGPLINHLNIMYPNVLKYWDT